MIGTKDEPFNCLSVDRRIVGVTKKGTWMGRCATRGNVMISARAHIEKLEQHVQFKFWQR